MSYALVLDDLGHPDAALREIDRACAQLGATVTVQSAASSATTQADPRGRFSIDVAADERIRLIVDLHNDGRERAVTEWFRA